jgi:hypothetical protein
MVFDEAAQVVKTLDQPGQVVGILRSDKPLQFPYGNRIQRGAFRPALLLRQVASRELTKTRIGPNRCAIAACLDAFQYALKALKEIEHSLTGALYLIDSGHIGSPSENQFRMNRKSGNGSDQILGLFEA